MRRQPQTLVELARHRAIEQAERLAYIFLQDGEEEELRLTYGELDQRARKLAVYLQERGAQDRRVLLLYPPGIEYIVAFMGCLYAGAVAVPAYPPRLNRSLARLSSVAGDAEATLALTTAATRSRIGALLEQQSSLYKLEWLTSEEASAASTTDWREPALESPSLAFLQYTSGSTGEPKGVMISHQNLLHNSRLLAQAFEYNEQSCVVSWLPLYHDMGLIGGMLQPLYGGFPSVLMSPAAFLQRPMRWLQAVTRFHATISGAPNFAYDLCARRIRPEDKTALDLSSWRVAFNGAEPLRAQTLDRFTAAFAECGFRRDFFFPCYGLAEATLIVSGGPRGRQPIIKKASAAGLERHRVLEEGGDDVRRELVSCGRGLSEQIVIVDPETRMLRGPAEVGEIWVAGGSVAGGYWNKAHLTSDIFHARLADTGEGPFLRTGDLGFMQDGELYLTGRLKDLMIIRGFNHYPQDIEYTVERSSPALRPNGGAAFVVESGREPGRLERLVVIHEVEPSASLDYAAIVARIRQEIAEEHGLQVDAVSLIKPGALPKTSSGKTQRQACKIAYVSGEMTSVYDWRSDAQTADDEALESHDHIEEPDLRLWLASRLGAKLRIDAAVIAFDQPLSRYGLDSLASIELAHEIEEKLGVSFPHLSLLESQSVAELADQLQARVEPEEATFSRPVGVEEPPGEYELSNGQQALWFLHQVEPESAAYNLAAAALIHGALDVPAFKRSVEALVERHAALRTHFPIRDGKPAREIAGLNDAGFEIIDAEAWEDGSLHRWLAEAARSPFDLAVGPLFRLKLLRRSSREHALLLSLHHTVGDFWSLSILIRDLAVFYSAQMTGSPAPKPQSTPAYGDFVAWQEAMSTGPDGRVHMAYWERRLSGELPVLNLPSDRPRPPSQSSRGAAQRFRLNASLTRKIKTLSQSNGTTLFITLLAAFQAWLHRHTGQDDILVGSLTAGRKKGAWAETVGYFVNPVVLRADLSGDLSFRDLMTRTKRSALDDLAHQDFPFPLLVEKLQPQRDPSRSPLFQAMFVLQKPPMIDAAGLAALALGESGVNFRLGELDFETLAIEHRSAQFDLTVAMAEVDGELHGSWQYNVDLFDAETAARMATRFKALLRSVVDDPDQSIESAALLPHSEMRRLVSDWNNTEREISGESLIHEAITGQARLAPEACAVVYEDDHLCYGELDRRANQLARYLRTLDVGPDARVGLYLDRGPELIIGLLGVLKAGGAYAPVDPALPAERRAYILNDAGVSVLLTQNRLASQLAATSGRRVCLDTDWPEIARESSLPLAETAVSGNLCYVIYTSGSTGTPKGVMVTHGNVMNFFAGMEEKIERSPGDAMLAVTGLSFDISVLELLWTLAGGGRVIVVEEAAAQSRRSKPLRDDRRLDFSLFYFASDDSQPSADGYRLLLEGAKFADRHNFSAVWTPERHFHPFGGLYPNPAVTGAALAAVTERVQIRAGSVVLPLHNPIRVAEEWALVDNLSQGRVGVAFASGWHADDFVFYPDRYAERKARMFEGIETVRRLWRGDAVVARGGGGNDVEVKIYPKPIRPELPIWLTAAGAADTFIKAGEGGFNVLTHLLGQTLEEVAEKIRLYRDARARQGHDPAAGKVTLMLHTFLGESRALVRETVKGPFTNYLRSSIGLIGNLVKSLNLPFDLNALSRQDEADLLAYAFDRYFETGALFGTPETCQAMIDQVLSIGVDEVACLIDFGVQTQDALDGLRQLAVLKDRRSLRTVTGDSSLTAGARRRDATLFQCTPSLMGMLSQDPAAMESLTGLRSVLLGGEALPPKLARQLKDALPAKLLNMYGPTETTVWSAVHEVKTPGATVPIGRPIANTQLYVFDRRGRIAPIGVDGELHIGGEGVARGYLNRPDLTAERFLPDPFSKVPGRRLYKTGDLARMNAEGEGEFLGRVDYQVKIRGHRIELEEIESVICRDPAIAEAVVIAREDVPGDQRLVAYLTVKPGATISTSLLRQSLKARLPESMLPSNFVTLEQMPQTSNGKIDRKSLPAPELTRATRAEVEAPRNRLEKEIAEIWRQALKIEQVGIHDNFFDLGGHSLLLAQVHRRLRELLKRDLPLIKVLEHPTISSLAAFLTDQTGEPPVQKELQTRAQKQRSALSRRGAPGAARLRES